MTMSILNENLGHYGCRTWCALVTVDGSAYNFVGDSIPGVCFAIRHRGKTVIIHRETTFVVQWSDDGGEPFPQETWDEGFFWLAERAPTLSREGFTEFIRRDFPQTTDRWEVIAIAEAEFGLLASAAEIATIKAAKERIAAEKSAYEKKREQILRWSPLDLIKMFGE